MQQKTQLLATNTKIRAKKPSKVLEKLIDKCVSEFAKLNIAVNKALERGRLEGFEDRQVGDMIRRKMIAAGYSRMTVSRALPPSAKHMEKARNISPKSGNKMLPKPSASVEPMLPNKDKDRTEFGNKMLPNLEGIPMKPNIQMFGFKVGFQKWVQIDALSACPHTYMLTFQSLKTNRLE